MRIAEVLSLPADDLRDLRTWPHSLPGAVLMRIAEVLSLPADDLRDLRTWPHSLPGAVLMRIAEVLSVPASTICGISGPGHIRFLGRF